MQKPKEKTLADFMNMAIPVRKPFPVTSMRTGDFVFYPERFLEKEGVYNVDNDESVVSFIKYNTMYVLPCFKELMELLKSNSFIRDTEILVPLSIASTYPLKYVGRWQQLLNRYFKCRDANFLSDCESKADEMGIDPIPDTFLKKRCMEIPDDGILMQDTSWIHTIYPQIRAFSRVMDETVSKKIGTYNICNGICIFVYRNGQTYITSDADIISFIQENGFILKDSMRVPLSNGELIVDENIQKWEAISA